MSKNKKYSIQIEQIGSIWRAQITRQVTSRKSLVTKEKKGFKSETTATAWAEKELRKFTKTLADSNARHGEQRKESEQIQSSRSSRRADKTKQAKEEKAKAMETDPETATAQVPDVDVTDDAGE